MCFPYWKNEGALTVKKSNGKLSYCTLTEGEKSFRRYCLELFVRKLSQSQQLSQTSQHVSNVFYKQLFKFKFESPKMSASAEADPMAVNILTKKS